MTSPLRSDQDLDAAVRSWLRENDEPTPDRGRHIGRIMGRVDETRQRRRLWPLDPFRRRAVHSATGTRGDAPIETKGTAILAPARVLAALALALVVTTSLAWLASQPRSLPLPAGEAGVDAADQVVLDRLGSLWAGEETDLQTTLETYAEDAVHHVLWLDHVEVVRGATSMWQRMRQSAIVDQSDSRPIRLPDDWEGSHRYLLVPAEGAESSLTGTACVVWIRDERITRHDCVLPAAFDGGAWPTMVFPDQAAESERERLVAAILEAQETRDRAVLDRITSPDIEHHVVSQNQVYTLEGMDEYWWMMSTGGPPEMYAVVDLPAPAGEVRWANVVGVGDGALCVFWAKGGLITRHDCIVPGITTVPATLTQIVEPPADWSPG